MQSDYVMLLHFIVEAAFNYICFGGIEKNSTKGVNFKRICELWTNLLEQMQ